MVREHLETFLDQARELNGQGYPRFIERDFRRYLACGILSRGFARVRCPACGHERLLAFSPGVAVFASSGGLSSVWLHGDSGNW